MTQRMVAFWLVAAGIFVACFAAALVVTPESNRAFADAASVLTFASLLAVGIERTVEFVWLLVDAARPLGGYFPLNVLMKQFAEVDTQTDRLLGEMFDRTRTVLDQVIGTGDRTAEEVATIRAKLDEVEAQRVNLAARFEQVRKLAPGSGRLGATAAIADEVSTSMHAALNGLGDAAVATQLAIVTVRSSAQTALEVIAALGDNPSRRIASLLFGASLGMLATGMIGVNLFEATLGDLAPGAPELVLAGRLGVVITGIIVGLGSGPTHEVVKGLQRYKEARGRMAIPDLATSTGAVQGIAGEGPGAPIAGSRVMIRATH